MDNKKEIEQKKLELLRYLHLVNKLDQKCLEAEKWSGITTGGVLTVGRVHSYGSVTHTLSDIHMEVEALAEQVYQQRQLLLNAIQQLPGYQLRDFMEARYLSGLSPQQIANKYTYSRRQVDRLLCQGVRLIKLAPAQSSEEKMS